jgi:hypothetical protein
MGRTLREKIADKEKQVQILESHIEMIGEFRDIGTNDIYRPGSVGTIGLNKRQELDSGTREARTKKNPLLYSLKSSAAGKSLKSNRLLPLNHHHRLNIVQGP